MATPDVVRELIATAQIYGRELSKDAATMYLRDLDGYPAPALLTAFARCRKELRNFPTVADILARIDDGRPGVETAWAMIPLSEAASVVWTAEMRDAFGQVRALCETDPVAGRMAFKEIYAKLLLEARDAKRPVHWEPSLGHDPSQRAKALLEAERLGRLSHDRVTALLPHLPSPKRQAPLELEGPAEPTRIDPSAILAEIRARITGGGGA